MGSFIQICTTLRAGKFRVSTKYREKYILFLEEFDMTIVKAGKSLARSLSHGGTVFLILALS
ncbi:MAG: hypothetical protein M3525_13765, partial [Acidobacteriota bacterium]|nr:hypothetical protein [Acidobacteriota bacterium]